MRVFVAFGYTPDESWIGTIVIPMLEDLGLEVVHGQVIVQSDINTGIRALIESSDALIGFLLKRDKTPDRKWSTSPYVPQEINIAMGSRKAVIQVVEDGVTPVAGMLQGTQHLTYREGSQAQLLAALVRHVREWIRGEVYLKLGPRELLDEINVHGKVVASCDYDVLHQGHVERTGRSPIFKDGGSLCVKLIGFREGRSAVLTIDAPGRRWSSLDVRHANPLLPIKLVPTT